ASYESGVDELYFIGIATEDMVENQIGFVTTFGKVRQVDGRAFGTNNGIKDPADTSDWEFGNVLWVSPNVAGTLTTIKPLAPNRRIPVAMVLKAPNQSNVTLMVRAEHGYHLDEIHDVRYTNLQDKELLAWNSADQVWENKSVSEIGDSRYVTLDTEQTISANKTFSSNIIIDGNVGIGTDTPSATLDIASSSSDTPLVITKANEDGVRETLMIATVAGTSNNEKFFINNGTIGNGNFAPVFGGYTEQAGLWGLGFAGFLDSTADGSDSSNYGVVDFMAARTTNAASPLNGTISNLQNRKAFTFRGETFNKMYMSILANGNVGIGTDTPSVKLDVSGDANIDGTLTVDKISLSDNSFIVETGDFTLSDSHKGATILLQNTAAITITIPALSAGHTTSFIAETANTVTFQSGTGLSGLNSFGNANQIAGIFGQAQVLYKTSDYAFLGGNIS
ncbi:MAG: Nitrincola phage, partial [Bacteroidota bacterium]